MAKKEKPNCYECKYCGKLAGSCHSRCEHPIANFASVGRVSPVTEQDAATSLDIKANYHGIKNGWFNWPYNFDPTWLENCEGFAAKDASG
jgi:hypothetical protein